MFFVIKTSFDSICRRLCCLERASFPTSQTQIKLGPKLVLPLAAVLPVSDTESDDVEPTSTSVFQNRQTSCFM